jgi:hypothetical protein
VLSDRARPHRFRRWDPNRATDGGNGAERRGGERQRRRPEHHVDREPVQQLGEPEKLVVKLDDHLAEPGARDNPDHHAHQRDAQCPFQVVPPDLTVAVAERLERRELRPLQRQGAGQRDVEDEGGHAQEDQRQDEAERLELRQLVLERPMGQLQRPRNGAASAVGLEQPIEAGEHLVQRGPRFDGQDDVVESALHVECAGERAALHPDHAEAALVRDELARANAVDVLGRQRDADDRQPPQPAIDDGTDRAAEDEPVRRYEPFAREDFVRAVRIDPSALQQHDVVHARSSIGGDRDEQARRRLGDTRDVERHGRRHPGLVGRHARNGGKARRERERRPRRRRKDVGKTLPLVVRPLRPPKGVEGRHVHHEDRDAAGDDHADGERLALHRHQVPQQFAIQRGDRHRLTMTRLAPRLCGCDPQSPRFVRRPVGSRDPPSRRWPRCA